MSFDKWKARLAGEKVPTFLRPDAWDEGYYRKASTERQPNGQWKILGYTPVSYFVDGNQLVGIIGDREMSDQEIGDETLWSYVVSNPIPYEWYQAVAERGEPWPDEEKWQTIVPPVEAANPDEPPKPRNEVLAASIRAEIEKAPKEVKSAEDDAKAVGAKNRIAELRLAATKEGEAIYKPIFERYKKFQKMWADVIAPATTEEARLNKAVLTFREAERQKAVAAAAEAARKAAAELEANQRAADRAIANGTPEALPVVAVAPPETQPAPAPVVPTYGKRNVKADVKKFAVIEDWGKVFAHFQTDADLRARLEKLATDAIRAGAAVPGATHREGLV